MTNFVTWNLLYSSTTDHPSIHEKTAGNYPYNLWKNRCQQIYKEIISIKADIYFFQEVNSAMMKYISKQTALVYAISTNKDDIQCAIAYDFEKFDVVDSDWCSCARNIILRLRRKKDNKIFVLCSCHLKAGESRDADERRYQMISFILNKMKNLYGDAYVIAGDFNFDDQIYGSTYNELNRSLVGKTLERYHYSSNADYFPTFLGLNYKREFQPAQYDYIFISGACQFCNMPSVKSCEIVSSPNQYNPSDHLWVQVSVS